MNKYKVKCKGKDIDVYDVLQSFDVHCPAIQHAIKKLLKPGQRGVKDYDQDITEAIQSLERSKELHQEYTNNDLAQNVTQDHIPIDQFEYYGKR